MHSRDDSFDLDKLADLPEVDWSQVKPLVDDGPHWSEKFQYDQYDWDTFDAPYRVIQLTRGYFTIVDAHWYEKLGHHHWTAHVQRRPDGSIAAVYAARTELISRRRRKYIYLHRVVADAKEGEIVDHRNHYGLDNREGNLHAASHSTNMANRSLTGRSLSHLPRGVREQHNARGEVSGYRARIRVRRTERYSKTYPTPERAARWYRLAYRIVHGTHSTWHEAVNEPEFPPRRVGDLGEATEVHSSGITPPFDDVPF